MPRSRTAAITPRGTEDVSVRGRGVFVAGGTVFGSSKAGRAVAMSSWPGGAAVFVAESECANRNGGNECWWAGGWSLWASGLVVDGFVPLTSGAERTTGFYDGAQTLWCSGGIRGTDVFVGGGLAQTFLWRAEFLSLACSCDTSGGWSCGGSEWWLELLHGCLCPISM